jgi:hypothetical protein
VGSAFGSSETWVIRGLLKRGCLSELIYDLGMAAGMDFSPPITLLEGGCNRDNVSTMEDQSSENLNNLKQITNGKPPRHLSIMRHSVSSMKLQATADLVSSSGLSQPLYIGCF